MLLLGHPRFRLANVENHFRAFNAFHGCVEYLSYAANVFLVNSLALGFPHFLEDDLLGNLRGNAAQSFCRFEKPDFAANLGIVSDGFGFIERDLKLGIFDVIFRCNNALHRVNPDISAVFVQFANQVFLAFVFLAGGRNNGVLHRADYNLRINTFFAAQRINYVVNLARHRFPYKIY